MIPSTRITSTTGGRPQRCAARSGSGSVPPAAPHAAGPATRRAQPSSSSGQSTASRSPASLASSAVNSP